MKPSACKGFAFSTAVSVKKFGFRDENTPTRSPNSGQAEKLKANRRLPVADVRRKSSIWPQPQSSTWLRQTQRRLLEPEPGIPERVPSSWSLLPHYGSPEGPSIPSPGGWQAAGSSGASSAPHLILFVPLRKPRRDK